MPSPQKVKLDQSANLTLVFRKGEGRPLMFQFLEDSNNHNISSYGFVFQVLGMDSADVIFELTEDSGGGLTNGGVLGLLTVDPSDDNVDLDEKTYIWKLKTTNPETETRFNGKFVINNSPQSDTEADTATVNIDFGDVVVQVNVIMGSITGTQLLEILTDANIAELYNLLLPYINGEIEPGGPSDYIGTLYTRLLPYITGEL